MILAKAPLRLSFFGGGSDVPEHYQQWGGNVISTAIDKYVYVAVNETPHNHIKLSYSKQELVTDVDDLENDIVKNTLKYFSIKGGIDISSFADIPTVGTGLAGSSAFTCALVRAIAGMFVQKGYQYQLNEFEVAEIACIIELGFCGWRIGKQDQYASAFGGMNHIEFHTDDRVTVNRINPNGIDKHLILVPTKIDRHAAEILGNVDFKDKTHCIRELSHLASLHSVYLPEMKTYGEVLNECWKLKKQMSGEITNPQIDEIHDRCISAGAIGCKLLGAGGGGYMLAIADDIRDIMDEFSDRVCLEVKVASDGAKVVYCD